MSFNKVILSGYVGKVGEPRKSKDDKSWITLSLATDSGYAGNKKTYWHNLMAFGKTADVIEKYVGKGSQIIVDGEITYSQWEDKNGVKKDQTTIMVSSVSFIGKKPEKSDDTQTASKEEIDDIPF